MGIAAEERVHLKMPEQKVSRSRRKADVYDEKNIPVEVAVLGVKLDSLTERVDRLELRMDDSFTKQDLRIEHLFEKQNARMEERFAKQNLKIEQLFEKQDAKIGRFCEKTESKITGLEGRVLSLEKKMYAATAVICGLIIAVNMAAKLL